MAFNIKSKPVQERIATIFVLLLIEISSTSAQNSALPPIVSFLFDEDSIVVAPTIHLEQNYDGLSNDAPWPAPWVVAPSSPVQSFTIQNGQACLEGLVLTGGMPATGEQNLARLVTPSLNIANFDASFQITLEDPQNQGLGFYGIQNGGFFTLSDPDGQGYGIFIRGYSADEFTFWYEFEGDEVLHHQVSFTSIASVGNSFTTETYNIRYQVEYIDPTVGTIQRAKIWLAGSAEPENWIIPDTIGTDFPAINPRTIPSLQNITGGFVVDLYNFNNPGVENATTASACIDNLIISAIN